MNPIKANIKIEKKGQQTIKIDNATKLRFSPFRCFTYNDGLEERKIINLLGEYLISKYSDMAIYGKGKFFDYFMKHFPQAKPHFKYLIDDNSFTIGSKISDIPAIPVDRLPKEIKTVFLCLPHPKPHLTCNIPVNPDIYLSSSNVSKHFTRVLYSKRLNLFRYTVSEWTHNQSFLGTPHMFLFAFTKVISNKNIYIKHIIRTLR